MRCFDPIPLLQLRLLHFNPGNQLFLIVRAHFLPLREILIEPLEPLELSEDGLVELVDALEGLLADCLLVVGQEQPPEVFIKEEVPRVEGRLRLGQLVQVLTDLVGLWRVEFQEEVAVGGRVLAWEREQVETVG